MFLFMISYGCCSLQSFYNTNRNMTKKQEPYHFVFDDPVFKINRILNVLLITQNFMLQNSVNNIILSIIRHKQCATAWPQFQTNCTPFHTCLLGIRFGAQTLSCVGFFRYLKAEHKKKKSLQVYELEGFGFGLTYFVCSFSGERGCNTMRTTNYHTLPSFRNVSVLARLLVT